MSDSTHDYASPPPATFLEPGQAGGFLKAARDVIGQTASVNGPDWDEIEAQKRALLGDGQEADVVRGLTTREVINRQAKNTTPQPCRGGDYCDTQCPGYCKVNAPTDEVPADPPPPAGPTPVLEGTFAIFVTPEESIVVAYRPRGADADKHFVVPAFLVAMATQQTGHTVADIVAGLKEGL